MDLLDYKWFMLGALLGIIQFSWILYRGKREIPGPGQFLIYGNQIFDRWQSGHIHYFDWQNLPHATANASLHPRPMLVLTGVMTDRTRELIKVQSNHYLI